MVEGLYILLPDMSIILMYIRYQRKLLVVMLFAVYMNCLSVKRLSGYDMTVCYTCIHWCEKCMLWCFNLLTGVPYRYWILLLSVRFITHV